VGATGFEPVKAEPADLQAAFCCTKKQEFSHLHGAFVSDYLHEKTDRFCLLDAASPVHFSARFYDDARMRNDSLC
jgi:hypothetical protein